MNEEVILNGIAEFLSVSELWSIYRSLTTLTRSVYRDLISGRRWITGVSGFDKLTSDERLALAVNACKNMEIFREFQSSNGDNLLHRLAKKNDVRAIYMFGDDPRLDEMGCGGMNILHYAAMRKNFRLCQYLVSLKRSLADIVDEIGRLPEDWAYKQGAFDLGEFLRQSRQPPPADTSPQFKSSPRCFSCISLIR